MKQNGPWNVTLIFYSKIFCMTVDPGVLKSIVYYWFLSKIFVCSKLWKRGLIGAQLSFFYFFLSYFSDRFHEGPRKVCSLDFSVFEKGRICKRVWVVKSSINWFLFRTLVCPGLGQKGLKRAKKLLFQWAESRRKHKLVAVLAPKWCPKRFMNLLFPRYCSKYLM